jgi:uncharacterized NAD(P)/FAD-binding protein YdhS
VTDIAVVGLGPWGLAFVERLIAIAHADRSSDAITLHVIDPGAPGCGAFDTEQPDYLILNTPCGWHSVAPELEPPHPGTRQRSMMTWLLERDYRWEGDACRPGGSGRPVSPDDFLPRKVMGEYLEWSFNVLLAEAPDNVEVVHHRSAAIDLVPLPSGRESLTLADGTCIDVDHVVLATGHTPNDTTDRAAINRAIPPYPVSRYDEEVQPGEVVAVRGMGLVAMDVMVGLTVGRGGIFEESPRSPDRLQYRPSGREPIIHMFSRTGYPYCARDSKGRSSRTPHHPAICTPEAVKAIKRAHPMGEIDVRRDFLPLLFAEMQLRYYTRAAALVDDTVVAAKVYAELARAWRKGGYAEMIDQLATRYGEFDAEQHFFAGKGAEYLNAKDYEQQVYDLTEADLEFALDDGSESPVKAAYGIPRQLRDTIRSVVDGHTLTPESQLDFQCNIRPRIGRLIAGPPILRIQQFLALIDADVVRLVAGPMPKTEISEGGGVVLMSQQLRDPVTIHADRLLLGTLDDPTVSRSASPLLASLYRQGRVRPRSMTNEEAGGIELNDAMNPVNHAGQPERSLWVMGSVTEGARYYTGYIPSPRDMRASRDSAACIATMLKPRP